MTLLACYRDVEASFCLCLVNSKKAAIMGAPFSSTVKSGNFILVRQFVVPAILNQLITFFYVCLG